MKHRLYWFDDKLFRIFRCECDEFEKSISHMVMKTSSKEKIRTLQEQITKEHQHHKEIKENG